MTNPLIFVLEIPGKVAAAAMKPVWDEKSQTTAYNVGYYGKQGEFDCLRDNQIKEILVMRPIDKENPKDWLEGIPFSQLEEYIKKGKLKRTDLVYLHHAQPVPVLAENALSQFGIEDWGIEKKVPEGSELIEEFKKLLATATAPAPAPTPAPTPAAEMLQLMLQMQQALEQNKKLEKQVEDLLAEKEVKKANPVT